ncbi:MAG: hypothetical protein ACI9U2_003745 [Bradymonadia bacterium]|jgi:hypothetical protein
MTTVDAPTYDADTGLVDLEHPQSPGFLDAERIFRTLEAVERSRALYVCAAEKFPVVAGQEAMSLDRPAFSYLVSEDFLQVPHELHTNIDRFRQIDGQTQRIRDALKETYRRMKTVRRQAQLDERKGGLLSGQVARWTSKAKVDASKTLLDDLALKRRGQEGELERAGTMLREILDRVYRDEQLRAARWFCERPVLMTPFGAFLLDYLGDMNASYFRGRTLAEIIEVGPALA